MLAALGRLTVARRFLFLGAWGILLVLGVALSGSLFDGMTSVDEAPPGAESTLAQARLDALDPEGEIITAVIVGDDFFSPELVHSASAVMAEIRALPNVVEVVDAYTSGGLIGDDARSSLVSVELDQTLSEDDALAAAAAVSALLHSLPADVLVGGELLGEQAFVDRAMEDAMIGEGIAVLVLLVVLVIILGGFRVGILPVVAALVTITTALLVLSGVVQIMAVNEFALNIVTILGLGLTVDYSLLLIMRFREEREADPDASLEDLMARTVASSGRAVLISGLAVCIALVGILLLGDPLLSGMALGGAIVVILATIAGITLVPAAIAVIHRRIPAKGARTWARPWTLRRPSARPGLLGRTARFAQRRAILVTIGATAVLLLLAAPVTALVLDSSDIRSLPADAEPRLAYDAITTGFADLGVEPVTVVIDASVDDPGVRAFLDEIAALDGVDDARVLPDLPPDLTAVAFTPTGGEATGAQAQQLVQDVRGLDTALNVQVTGPAAGVVDTQAHLQQRIPLALGVVALSTFALLFALTRSIIVPLKALALSALTIAATLGALVAIFQWGWGSSLLGFEAWGALDVTAPLFIGLLAFGLTMDYEVFLLARIHEHWRRRDPSTGLRAANDAAVLRGIVTTGPVVTTAAVAIGIVFLGFAVGGLVAMKAIGIGMLIAVVVDVTIIRGLLLPAVMTLLGKWNWWPSIRTREAEEIVGELPATPPVKELVR